MTDVSRLVKNHIGSYSTMNSVDLKLMSANARFRGKSLVEINAK